MRNNQSIENKVQDFHESIIFSNQYNKYLTLSAVSYPSVKFVLGAYRGCLLVKEFVNVWCLHALSMIYQLIAFGSCAFCNLWYCVELPLVLYLQFILWLVSVYLVRVFGILYTRLIIYYLHHSLPKKPPDIPYVIKYSITRSQKFPIVIWDNHTRLKQKKKRYYNSSEQIFCKQYLFSTDKVKRTTGGVSLWFSQFKKKKKKHNNFIPVDKMEQISNEWHKMIHKSWIMYDMAYGSIIDSIIGNANPAADFALTNVSGQLAANMAATFLTLTAGLSESTVKFQNLITQARMNDKTSDVCYIRTYRVLLSESSSTPIVIDTGASTSITPFIEDFVGKVENSDVPSLQGLGSKSNVQGRVIVEWAVRDMDGVTITVRTGAYLVTGVSIRLLSLQKYFQENATAETEGDLQISARIANLTLPEGTKLRFPMNKGNNLPLTLLSDHVNFVGISKKDFSHYSNLHQAYMTVADETNQNLQRNEKELVHWHHCLSHIGLSWTKSLFSKPRDPSIIRRTLKSKFGIHRVDVSKLKCAGCELGKRYKRSSCHRHGTHKLIGNMPKTEMKMKINDLLPGDCVSTDQYISTVPERCATSAGKKKEKFTGGTIFVDHATQYIYAEHQHTLTAGNTVVSKTNFEQELKNKY